MTVIRTLQRSIAPSFVQREHLERVALTVVVLLLVIGVAGCLGVLEDDGGSPGEAGDANGTGPAGVESDLRTTASLQADAVSEWADSTTYQARYLGQFSTVADGDPADVRARLAAQQTDLSGVGSVHVVDLESNTVVGSTANVEAISAGAALSEIDAPWATEDLDEAVANGDPWVSGGSYQSRAVPDERVVAVAAQTAEPDRAVVVTARLHLLLAGFEQSGVPARTVVLDAEGNDVFAERGSDVLADGGGGNGSAGDQDLLQGIRSANREDTVRFRADDGTLRAFAPITAPSAAGDWVAVTSVPEDARNDSAGSERPPIDRETVGARAALHADVLAAWRNSMEYQARYVGELPDVPDGDENSVETRLLAERGALRGVQNVHVVSTETNSVVATTASSENVSADVPFSEIEEPWAREDLGELVAGANTYVSESASPSRSVPGTRIVAFAQGTRNISRAVVVSASIDARLDQLELGGDAWTTEIVNADGQYVLNADGTGAGAIDDRNQLDAIWAADADAEVQFTSTDDALRAYAPIRASDWVVVTTWRDDAS